jgi:hypothetical protein
MVWIRIGRPSTRLSAAGPAAAAVTMAEAARARTVARPAGRAAKVVAAAILAAICVLALVVNARAGDFHVYSCRMPNGEVAPTDGWSGMTSGSGVLTEDKCATGGALLAGLSDGETHEVEADRSSWVFSAPAGANIVSAKLWRAGDADGGWGTNATYEFWLAGPENEDIEADVIDQCVAEFGCPTGAGDTSTSMSSSNLVSVPSENLGTHLYVNVSCGGSAKFKCPSGKGDANGYAAVVYLYAADLTLEQTSQPRVSEVEGELATATMLNGTDDLSFHAEDEGSGVYEAVFTVDGKGVASTVLASNGGHCQNVAQTTDALPAFLYLRPCPASLRADVPFDTTALTDGNHHLVVSVTNAAGNSTVALDRNVDVKNDTKGVEAPTDLSPEGQTPQSTEQHAQPIQITPEVGATAPAPAVQPQNNGTNATQQAALRVRWRATARAALAGSYGRAETVSGRLTTPGTAPIGGAVVQVLDTPAYERAPTRVLGTARTAANGVFSFHVPASTPSARLTFAYSAQPGTPAPAVTASLQQTVPASLSLKIAPHTTRRGGGIVFSGKLRGAPLPPGGKQLVLEARTLSGQWRQFQVLTTARGGSYRATYHFRLAGPIDYKFRVVSQQEADFPYAEGASNVVLVHER